jgi:hypothetical protein
MTENEKVKHRGTCAQFDDNLRDCVFVEGFERCFFEDSTNKCLEKTGIDFVMSAQ